MLVRRARTEDLPAMRRAFRAAGLAAWPHIIPAERLAENEPPPRWTDSLESSDERTAVLAGELDAEVVGFAIVRPSGDDDVDPSTVGELDALYSHPSVWGRGIGRALLEQAVDFLRSAGFGEATLWTAEENHRPRRIYERGGWRLDGARRARNHLGSDFVELRYRREL
jgi:GNAT superfamily N-acetyltransferase